MARRKVYLFVLAVLLVLLTALLSAAALRIWQEGSARKAENPLEAVYTPEKVKEQMLRISPLLFAVAGMAAVGLLMGIRDEESIRPVSSPETERDRLSARLGAPGEGIRKERKRQRILRWIRWTAFAACMVPVMIYCAEKGHFPEDDLEAMIVALVFHTGPWVAAGLLMLSAGNRSGAGTAERGEKPAEGCRGARRNGHPGGTLRPGRSAGGSRGFYYSGYPERKPE